VKNQTEKGTDMSASSITTHRNKDKVVTWVEVVEDGYHAAFRKEEGEVVETVEFDFEGDAPNWDEAGYTDPAYAADPDLLAEVTRRLS
jgi:hypothetical protein